MNRLASGAQLPAPGTSVLLFRGDAITFTLDLPSPAEGSAWLRTNIGQWRTAASEIRRNVLYDTPLLGRDWFDIPMIPEGDRRFRATLPLCEVGHFEAKAYFLAACQGVPVWPEGANTVVNVEPAGTCCANIIYNAFVRQFGPNKSVRKIPSGEESEWIGRLDAAGYTVIPPSGTFRDLIRELDFIVGELGCRFIQLLPIHPTPTTYGRMGRFGSPFASLSFISVDPALAEFDPRATPMEQFIELVDAVHRRNAKLILDIAINHTGWAAALHALHPEWVVRDPDGRIEMPGAWGVRWEDLTMLDYRRKDLWDYMAGVFLAWCKRGVDGFRCDAGYMIPVPAWKYIVASVRDEFPDTVFLLEGLGGKVSVTREILDSANFDWGYSELFQNYDRSEIERYLPEAIAISESEGIMIHFAETHDNNRLASRSPRYARMRTALCALASTNGGFGFANGVEWLATEKIDVHDACSLNWGAAENQVDLIRRLNAILKRHPAFHDRSELKMIQAGGGNQIALLRHHRPTGKRLLVLANLDAERPAAAGWNREASGIGGSELIDLITGERIVPEGGNGVTAIPLGPGEVRCLSPDRSDLALIEAGSHIETADRVLRQQLRAKALDVFRAFNGTRDLGRFDPDEAGGRLAADPVEYCREFNRESAEPMVTGWRWPRDLRREAPVPPGHFLLVRSPHPFRARICENERNISLEESLPCRDGSFFALFSPLPAPSDFRELYLKLSVYAPDGCTHGETKLLYLPRAEDISVRRAFGRREMLKGPLMLLGTNGRGGMLRAHAAWGKLQSRYDALLAGNMSPDFPEDRRIMFARCRAWLVFQGFSQEISIDCADGFVFDYGAGGIWRFNVPSGQGEHVPLSFVLRMTPEENEIRIVFFREPSRGATGRLADDKEVRLILRPDIENRGFHETTKAYLGPEHHFPASVAPGDSGFRFSPDSWHLLRIDLSPGRFVHEPEWHYMVHRPIEAARGLDPDSDLFSPGYFFTHLRGGESAELSARIESPGGAPAAEPPRSGSGLPACLADESDMKPSEALNRAMDQYLVRRGELRSVVAGYPWFLDWGRDSLIFVRGLIAARRFREAREVLLQFGRFEAEGTLPNAIAGNDAGNRDTSDAPLWFVSACAELAASEGESVLEVRCDRRTIREVLLSIGRSFVKGTPNGVRMDPASGLIFSPAHFTWMDTNYPAGSPREGYPVEIQALWYASLRSLARISPTGEGREWSEIAESVGAALAERFYLTGVGYLSDCLHAESGRAAADAEPDDALRPNQLLAITLGALRDPALCRSILAACEELLVPGGIRSLADRPLRRPLTICHQDRILSDPCNPYRGTYTGDEDTRRKPSYHNGTAWTWLFPSFCEAWVAVYGKKARTTALAWLGGGIRLLEEGCAGHVPEILDGDAPHTPRGCDAQAWGVSELYRVWRNLGGA